MQKFSSHAGQSLVEVVIALFVLTTGFLGIMSLLARSASISAIVNKQSTATYLAAEGIELAKNIIDHDVYAHLAGVPGQTGWGTAFSTGGAFALDYTTCNNLPNQTTPCQPPITPSLTLHFDPTTKRYGANGSVTTGFVRTITITPSTNEITVQSTVTWTAGSLPQSVALEDHFYNWHP